MNKKVFESLMSASLMAAGWPLAGCWSSEPARWVGDLAGSPAPDSPAHEPAAQPPPSAARAADVVAFWREAGPSLWFAKDPEFDRRFRERFAREYAAAAREELGAWLSTPEGALGLVLLLDQYPRNAFRGTPRMYATDALARRSADAAIRAGHDRAIDAQLRVFMYLPFGHSEDLRDQERSVELVRSLGQPSLSHAEGHRDIVRRFGRFPHRNTMLGRSMRPEEQKFLDEGGFSG
jgi:uncharacterized protein (DUF924 family)